MPVLWGPTDGWVEQGGGDKKRLLASSLRQPIDLLVALLFGAAPGSPGRAPGREKDEHSQHRLQRFCTAEQLGLAARPLSPSQRPSLGEAGPPEQGLGRG